MAKPGGVLRRAGHTEAGVDLARMAGFEPAALIVEIMNEDGTMARRPQLEEFAAKHELKMGTIADLIEYRALHEQSVELRDSKTVTTEFGDFELHTFLDLIDDTVHYALTRGDIVKTGNPGAGADRQYAAGCAGHPDRGQSPAGPTAGPCSTSPRPVAGSWL